MCVCVCVCVCGCRFPEHGIYLFIYLFIHGLFNDNVSIQDVPKRTVSKDTTISG